MTTTPDPKLVREIAEDAMRGAICDEMFWHVNQAVIEHGVPGPASKGSTFEVHRSAAIAEYKRMADAMDRPDGQPKNERDGYAVRLLNMLEADPDRFQESEEEDLRAALSALFRCTAEAANLATALAEAQAERGGATQAVAEAVSILEGMLNEDAWAYDAGRARGVLLDYFTRDLDALNAHNANGGE